MTITVNNQNIDFKKCLREINSKVECDIWKTFIEINKDKIEFQVINECQTCNTRLNDDINWNGVKIFLKELPTKIKDLHSKSELNLFRLAKQMKFWKAEYETDSYFYLDAIEFHSVNIENKRLNNLEFECLTYQMIFTLEKKNDSYVDIYGRWISEWTGSQITGIRREQR